MSRPLFPKLLARAEAARSRSQFKAALSLFDQASRQAPDRAAKATALQGLADCGRLLGELPASLKAYAAALALVPAADAAWRADLLSGQALAWRASGRPQRALRSLQAALQRYSRLRDPEGIRFCHWALGGTLRIAGQLPQALAHLKRAERLYRAAGDGEGAAYVDCALGGVNRMLGRWPESQRHYARANALMRARRDAFGTAYSYCGLGNAARMRGDLRSALGWFRRAERAYAKIGDRVSYAYTLWSLASAYKLLGQAPKAQAELRKAAGLFRGTGDSRGLAYVETTLAELAALSGRTPAARAHLKRAARHARAFAWEARHVRALAALIQGDPRGAGQAYAGSGSRFRPRSLPANWP